MRPKPETLDDTRDSRYRWTDNILNAQDTNLKMLEL